MIEHVKSVVSCQMVQCYFQSMCANHWLPTYEFVKKQFFFTTKVLFANFPLFFSKYLFCHFANFFDWLSVFLFFFFAFVAVDVVADWRGVHCRMVDKHNMMHRGKCLLCPHLLMCQSDVFVWLVTIEWNGYSQIDQACLNRHLAVGILFTERPCP